MATREYVRVGLPTLTYEAGQTYKLKPDHARRWVSRGVAEYVPDVVSPPDLAGPDSSNLGKRPEPDSSRRRGRPPSAIARSSDQHNVSVGPLGGSTGSE